MADEPKYPPYYNAEQIDQYETYLRDQKAAPQASKAASPETEEKPKFKLATVAVRAAEITRGEAPRAILEQNVPVWLHTRYVY